MIHIQDEKQLVGMLTPIIKRIADNSSAIAALEKGKSGAAGELAALQLIKSADQFLNGEPGPVSSLPHIAQHVAVLKATGRSVSDYLPEVTS